MTVFAFSAYIKKKVLCLLCNSSAESVSATHEQKANVSISELRLKHAGTKLN